MDTAAMTDADLQAALADVAAELGRRSQAGQLRDLLAPSPGTAWTVVDGVLWRTTGPVTPTAETGWEQA